MRFPCLCLALALATVHVGAQAQEAAEPETSGEGAEGEYDPHGMAAMRTQEMDEGEARSRFRIASTLYEEGRFLDAAREFEAAYALSGLASLQFNAYLAYRDAGQLADAVRTLGTYLENAPEAPDHERLSNRLSAMRRTLAENQAQDDAERLERERLEAEAEAERQRAAEERARANAAERATTRINPTGYVVGAVGLATILAGGAVGLIANSRYTSLEEDCPTGFCSRAVDVESKRSSLLRAQRATDALLYTGAAITVAGVILILVLPDRQGGSEEDVALRPAATCDGEGCQVSLGGSF